MNKSLGNSHISSGKRIIKWRSSNQSALFFSPFFFINRIKRIVISGSGFLFTCNQFLRPTNSIKGINGSRELLLGLLTVRGRTITYRLYVASIAVQLNHKVSPSHTLFFYMTGQKPQSVKSSFNFNFSVSSIFRVCIAPPTHYTRANSTFVEWHTAIRLHKHMDATAADSSSLWHSILFWKSK